MLAERLKPGSFWFNQRVALGMSIRYQLAGEQMSLSTLSDFATARASSSLACIWYPTYWLAIA